MYLPTTFCGYTFSYYAGKQRSTNNTKDVDFSHNKIVNSIDDMMRCGGGDGDKSVVDDVVIPVPAAAMQAGNILVV